MVYQSTAQTIGRIERHVATIMYPSAKDFLNFQRGKLGGYAGEAAGFGFRHIYEFRTGFQK